MIFPESRVLQPQGRKEARLLKPGDRVLSWNGKRWQLNYIRRVMRGQSKTAHSVYCFDGVEPMKLRLSQNRLYKTKELRSGQTALVSDGAHVFRAMIGATVTDILDAPETVFSFELERGPKNLLIEGFLCKP